MFEYACAPWVNSIYITQKNLRKKYYISPGGGAPLEGGARWLGHPSFYGSLVPGEALGTFYFEAPFPTMWIKC